MTKAMARRGALLSLALATLAAGARAEITGRVFSSDGKPVAGAMVTAHALEGTEARAKRLAAGEERRALATTRTVADGSFRLDAADRYCWWLSVRRASRR